jgi:predicted phage terminase large subunit-like protein
MPATQKLLGFAEHVLADQQQSPARHHRALIERLEDVAEGRCDRLMVQMPPGSAKSTYGSVLFPAYFLGRHPGGKIIATAHTASLAAHFGRQVRRVIVEYGDVLGLELDKDRRAANEFLLQDRGAYFAAGVRGPITGRRADLILIDDPIKSWAEAESPVFRDALYDWYRAELTARLRPGGRIVFIMTRWHDDDLAGRLARGDRDWTMLRLPALAEEDDPLGRQVGEPLWPEWQDAEAIEGIRREIGDRSFAAMYQQNPRPPESLLFDVKKIGILAEATATLRTVRAWDLAATVPVAGRDPDYTVGVKLGMTAADEIVVLDVRRIRGNAGEVENLIVRSAEMDGRETVVGLPQDPGQAGAAQIVYLKRRLEPFKVVATPETGAKAVRAMPAAAQIDRGAVKLIAAPWNDSFLRELEAFPDARKDDQVDAFSRAVSLVLEPRWAGAKTANLPFIGR